MVKLPDPEKCKVCNLEGTLIDSRLATEKGYRRRRRRCPKCRRRWNTYETTVNPKNLRSNL